MKKYFVLFIIMFLICGCGRDKKIIMEEKNDPNETVIDDSEKDDNHSLNIPIHFYQKKKNSLKMVHSVSKKDITNNSLGRYYIYFSDQEEVSLKDDFSYSFYDKWLKYQDKSSFKIGFRIQYHTSDLGDISYDIFDISNFLNQDYLEIRIFDDYQNRNHKEEVFLNQDNFNDKSLFSSIQLLGGSKGGLIDSKILIRVFTYTDREHIQYNNGDQFTICIDSYEC